ncbi:MAG: FAD-dependent oxidoreductase [Desulfobacterales bacterium]
MPEKNILIIGGGVAGLTAADELAKLDYHVDLIEKEAVLGGYAGQFACKATDECVQCGACMVEEKIDAAVSHPGIHLHLKTTIREIKKDQQFTVTFLDKEGSENTCKADAIIIATGFQPFNPENKPYGYKVFDDVITNLDLEKMLRQEGGIARPSDGSRPEKLAFIQCVGSRDARLNHLWCSKVCCASALRMANLIRSKNNRTDITFFYIDVQTFGKNFQARHDSMKEQIRMIRAIPGDIFKTAEGRLKITYSPVDEEVQQEEEFDMVVLSIGITPGVDNKNMAEKMGVKSTDTGFWDNLDACSMTPVDGIFAAGTASGPKSIAESVADAGRSAFEVVKYLNAHVRLKKVS